MAIFGGGGGLGRGGFGPYVSGPRGPWMGCGCSSLLMILAGFILVFAGCARMLNF
jgi:hypothetical protein